MEQNREYGVLTSNTLRGKRGYDQVLSKTATEAMIQRQNRKEVRCKCCGRMFFVLLLNGMAKNLEIKCPKCGKLNVVNEIST